MRPVGSYCLEYEFLNFVVILRKCVLLLVILRQMNLSAWNGKCKVYFEGFRLIWEDNIRMDIKEVVLYCVKWINLNQEQGQEAGFCECGNA